LLGDGTLGQLGDGFLDSSTTPVAVVGGLRFTAISVSFRFTCALTTSGAGACWGDNSFGQLGNGQLGNGAGPFDVPAAVTGGFSFLSVSPGRPFSDGIHLRADRCGLAAGGAAYCWGDNVLGQLGNGSITIPSSTPGAVAGGLSLVAVSAGRAHTCGVTANGTTYCWGDNSGGQLGDGSTTPSSAPVAVAGGLSFGTVSARSAHTCGPTAGGTAYCWGDNPFGQLGNNSTTSSTVPVKVAGQP